MTIWDTQVTQPYGYDPTYPSADHIHKGVDYGCPVGTDVTVNGVVIGKSGNTGYSTGPHCHVGHWRGGSSVPSNPQDGKTVSGAKVTEVGQDSTNGKFVRVGDADGSSWVYLHLSEQLVKVGDKLEGGSSNMEEPYNSGDAENLAKDFGTSVDAFNKAPNWNKAYYGAMQSRVLELRKNSPLTQADKERVAKDLGIPYDGVKNAKNWVDMYDNVIRPRLNGNFKQVGTIDGEPVYKKG